MRLWTLGLSHASGPGVVKLEGLAATLEPWRPHRPFFCLFFKKCIFEDSAVCFWNVSLRNAHRWILIRSVRIHYCTYGRTLEVYENMKGEVESVIFRNILIVFLQSLKMVIIWKRFVCFL